MKKTKKLLPLLCVLSLASCGGGGSSNSSSGGQEPQRQESMANLEGTYKAILRPYNFTISGWIPNGVTDIKVEGDQIEIKSWLDDSSNVTHMQNIHVGERCPDVEHDTNRDGFVDFNESSAVAGGVLLPLDADLTSQTTFDAFPKGNFTYYQKASLNDIRASLQQQNMGLEGKVIIIMGAAANRNLPATVSTVNGMSKELSVPIACGVIERF